MIIDILAGAVRGGTSIMYAGLGETVSERAGVVNLGTEGAMLVGALGGYAVTAGTGDPWIGVLGGALAGALLSLVHAVLVVSRGANQFASGLTLYFLALGVTALFGAGFVSRQINAFATVPVPVLSEIPGVGPVLFDHDPLVYVAYVAAPLVWWVLYRTRVGLLVRTAGERPQALQVHGYSVTAVRYGATVVGGALAGVAGSHLSIAYTNSWFENMVAGRGFIAVALVIFAMWNPLRIMAGAYLFGAALSLASVLQTAGVAVNQFALNLVPFVLTLAVLAVLGRRTLQAAPDELLRVFDSSRAA
ncbi:ABC transporter permease [Cellulomonas phragmiteti]|uniref:ABC transporter permease n=1 Tax=Cellulomonas phragmiteti TaxID=478780 RepID=A0ABQ4DIE7_9CELL|nr:ABC transporter permease [Cellulomonas phragmiteti]GIG39110.1 ABC transporter permease [Cellulomonas phragmiteti]